VKQVQATVQHIRNIFDQYLNVHNKLESSLRELSRNGDVQACKAARKAADAQFKELTKELKPLLTFLQSCSQATSILTKVCCCYPFCFMLFYFKQSVNVVMVYHCLINCICLPDVFLTIHILDLIIIHLYLLMRFELRSEWG
jgi:hypothetical protein